MKVIICQFLAGSRMHFSRQADILIVHLSGLCRSDCATNRALAKTHQAGPMEKYCSQVDGLIMFVSLLEQKSQSKDVKSDHILLQTSVLIEDGPLGNAGSFNRYRGSPSGSLWILRDLQHVKSAPQWPLCVSFR